VNPTARLRIEDFTRRAPSDASIQATEAQADSNAAARAAKAAALRAALRALGRVAVAFSGGVDSALLLAAAIDALGDRAVAVTALSESFASREREAAVRLAADLGAAHHLVNTAEVHDPRYRANTEARCYFCKDVVYRALADFVTRHDLGVLVDGMNRDDTAEHRPGRRAAEEIGVRSPLYEAGLTKADVRELARQRGLPVWDKPAMACLSSRVAYGEAVTPAKLARIEAAEQVLYDLGCNTVRVRQNGDTARIEVAPDEIATVVAARTPVNDALRALGFDRVEIDRRGYRRPGS
jgi:uncharacterized protein